MIPEENADEFITSASDQIIPNGIRIGSNSGSLSLPIQSPTQHHHHHQQQQQTYRTDSPQSGTYSPYGNSPVIDQSNTTGYMMMSPGNDYNKG